LICSGLPDVTVGAAKGSVSEDENGLKEQTFISPPMKVLNGDIINKWLPIDWPEGQSVHETASTFTIAARPQSAVDHMLPLHAAPNRPQAELLALFNIGGAHMLDVELL
jgi:hypothetical protein